MIKNKILAGIVALGIILSVIGFIGSVFFDRFGVLFPLGMACIAIVGYYQSSVDKKKGS